MDNNNNNKKESKKEGNFICELIVSFDEEMDK